MVDLRPRLVEYVVAEGAPWWIEARAWTDASKTVPRDLAAVTITANLWLSWRERSAPLNPAGTPATISIVRGELGRFHFGQPAATVSGVFVIVLVDADGDPFPEPLVAIDLSVRPAGGR